MKVNKLIYVFLLAVLTSFSTQSFAILVSMDGEGYVTSYNYFTESDPLNGSISAGDNFTSVSLFDNETINDQSSDEDYGYYVWANDVYTSTVSVSIGGYEFVTNSTQFKILNNYNGSDIYSLTTWVQSSDTELLIFDIILTDSTETALIDDSLILEPDLSLFDSTNFYIRSLDTVSGTLNYDITGVVTSLVDPPYCAQEPCDDVVASVPEPNTIFLLGLGLIAVFIASRKGRKEEAFTA